MMEGEVVLVTAWESDISASLGLLSRFGVAAWLYQLQQIRMSHLKR